MAVSPAHKFGQIIGDVLEDAIEPILKKFAEEHHLYLDKQGPRIARAGLKVSWTDSYGNTHDLDYVLERGGSEEKLGTPVAFIESAWRRYTKHSRNKAQEIQGAILPLAHTYSDNAPFIGVIIAGVFTGGAIQQLKSLGFQVLYFEYPAIIEAFKVVGIDASFEENTALEAFEEKIQKWENLTGEQKAKISRTLAEKNATSVESFVDALKKAITRTIKLIRVLPLHGKAFEYDSLAEAMKFIKEYNEKNGNGTIVRYEVEIRYNNNDEIRGAFKDKETALQFLGNYR